MISLYASGTQSATVTTEHFLSSPNVAGRFSLQVDLVNMVAGDVVEVRIYKMVLTGGTARVVWASQFSGAQPTDGLILVTDGILNTLTDTNAVRFSLKQTYGTSRDFPWAVINEEDYNIMGYGTVTTGASTTSVPTSSCYPAGGVANQYQYRSLVFKNDTTTAALRGVGCKIIQSTNAAAPTFTVSTLPTTPASGDTFVIV